MYTSSVRKGGRSCSAAALQRMLLRRQKYVVAFAGLVGPSFCSVFMDAIRGGNFCECAGVQEDSESPVRFPASDRHDFLIERMGAGSRGYVSRTRKYVRVSSCVLSMLSLRAVFFFCFFFFVCCAVLCYFPLTLSGGLG